ncbi:sulfite exporter TauE/SafE family protein 3-like [Fagus crenata]
MGEFGEKWRWGLRRVWMVVLNFLIALVFVSAQRDLRLNLSSFNGTEGPPESDYILRAVNFLWQPDKSGYQHVWPEIKFGWQIVVGTIVGFFGAAFGSVGGVGGGGIFVPMLSLIVGFDPKSATAISKCMIMGAAGSTVYYNLKLRHPTLDMPIIDYDLALLIQPMLMLGISIGVAFNVIFADWMVTVLLIVLFIGTSTKAFLKGVETWKKETIMKKEAAKQLSSNGSGGAEVEYKPLPSGPTNGTHKDTKNAEVPMLENIYWKELGLLVFVWVSFLAIQIAKNYTATCTIAYWALNLLQIPISFGVSLYEAISLYKGHRVIASKGDEGTNWKVHQLIIYCAFGVLGGIVGGLLGLGGGFIMGPLFLELGVPPQVSSATATFAMTFSSSMSVVEYYLLRRFPVPYALYFSAVATFAAFIGQHIVRKLIILFGRASLIIFILAFTIFVSAISLDSRTPARASSSLTTRTEPPPLTPPLPATTEQVAMNWIQRKIYLYNVTFGLYMLDWWERYLFNTLVIVLMWFILYNGSRYVTEICKRSFGIWVHISFCNGCLGSIHR